MGRCQHDIIVDLFRRVDCYGVTPLLDQPLVFTFGYPNYRAVCYSLLRRACLAIKMVVKRVCLVADTLLRLLCSCFHPHGEHLVTGSSTVLNFRLFSRRLKTTLTDRVRPGGVLDLILLSSHLFTTDDAVLGLGQDVVHTLGHCVLKADTLR